MVVAPLKPARKGGVGHNQLGKCEHLLGCPFVGMAAGASKFLDL